MSYTGRRFSVREHVFRGGAWVSVLYREWLLFEVADRTVGIFELAVDDQTWLEAIPLETGAVSEALRRGPPKDPPPTVVLPIDTPLTPQSEWLAAVRGLAAKLEIELPPPQAPDLLFTECGEVADAFDRALTASGEGLWFHPIYGVCSS